MSPSTLYWSTLDSPCGPLLALVDDEGRIKAIEFSRDRQDRRRDWEASKERWRQRGYALEEDPAKSRDLKSQLDEYFAGRRRDFDLDLAPEGTDFQRSVWTELEKIPFGETRSYAEVSQAIGRPTATRAVGAANGANPIPIVVPCHRVVGADGSLTGFGGGLAAKAVLLELEGAEPPQRSLGF